MLWTPLYSSTQSTTTIIKAMMSVDDNSKSTVIIIVSPNNAICQIWFMHDDDIGAADNKILFETMIKWDLGWLWTSPAIGWNSCSLSFEGQWNLVVDVMHILFICCRCRDVEMITLSCASEEPFTMSGMPVILLKIRIPPYISFTSSWSRQYILNWKGTQ